MSNASKKVSKLKGSKEIQILVNKSLELDKLSFHEESSDFSGILSEVSGDSDQIFVSKADEKSDLSGTLSEISNDSNRISVPVKDTVTVLQSLVPCWETSSNNQSELWGEIPNDRQINNAEKADKNVIDISNYFSSQIEAESSESSENEMSDNEELNSENWKFSTNVKENKNNGKHICSLCSKGFRYPSHLKRHIRSHNNISSKAVKPNKVKNNSIQKAKIPRSSNLKRLGEKQEQKCPFCLKVFRFYSKLERHLKTHVGLKPYTCQFCSKTFTEKFNLLEHMNIHKIEQSYACDFCPKTFNFKTNLNRHLQSHIAEKLFICNDCGDAFTSERNLNIHVQKHQEKTHKCTECEKQFKKKFNLQRHLAVHSNERKYPCDQCDYAARQPTVLKAHIKRRHEKSLTLEETEPVN